MGQNLLFTHHMAKLKLLPLPKNAKFFGGELLHGRRKSQRPLAHGQAVHLIIRSQWAKKRFALTHKNNRSNIENILSSTAKKYKIRIYRFSIVSNHIHIIFRARRRWLYRAFVCSFTGQIAQAVMGNLSFKDFLKGLAGEGVRQERRQHKEQRFWEHRPFTRILDWGKDYQICMRYLLQNTKEALGIIPYRKRTDYYALWKINLVPI